MIWAFGANAFGQLGNDSTAKSTVPVKVTTLPGPVKDVATKYFHNVSLTVTLRRLEAPEKHLIFLTILTKYHVQ